MRVPAWRRAARGDLLLFGGCLLISLLSLALPATWAAEVTTVLRSTLLRPIVMLQARAATDRTARFQLPQITSERDSLGRLHQEDATLLQENANLRALIQLGPKITLPYVAAEVLHQGSVTDSRMLLIGVGTAEGVALFDPVVTADGLVGEVWQTDLHSSSVLTWLHPEFRAHAVTAGSVLGMIGPVQGSSTQSVLELSGVGMKDTLQVGGVVYTSGLGGVYPRGIPIGRVIGTERDSLNYEKVYRVIPFVNPGIIAHALVLKATKGSVFLPVPGVTKKP